MNKTEIKKLLDECDWSELDGHGWAELLQWQPQLADRCDKWNEFSGYDWTCLIGAQPQFVEQCEWRSIAKNWMLNSNHSGKCQWNNVLFPRWVIR